MVIKFIIFRSSHTAAAVAISYGGQQQQQNTKEKRPSVFGHLFSSGLWMRTAKLLFTYLYLKNVVAF